MGAGGVNIHSIGKHLRSLINIETNAYTSYIQLWRDRYAKLTVLLQGIELTAGGGCPGLVRTRAPSTRRPRCGS